MKRFINDLYKINMFNEIDIRFAEFINKLDGNDDADMFLSAALVSSVTGGGDICLDLNRFAQQALAIGTDTPEAVRCPALPVWLEKLAESPVVGRPGEFSPLILDAQNRLYLYRYWDYQKKLANAIRQKAIAKTTGVNPAVLKDGLKRHFAPPVPASLDWQQIAAIAAVLNRFSVISGGPGTGKTYLVAKILALLLEQNGGSGLRIFLAAPTGKAANKLSETMKKAIQTLSCRDAILGAIPTEAATIHRLLKTIPHSPYFHYCEANPLPADVVVVDEASMIDLALMSKLFQALSVETRVILLGDRDQLASVEPGSVLGDICDPYHINAFSEDFCSRAKQLTGVALNAPDIRTLPAGGLHDSIIGLRKNYRFSETGGIGGLSRAVKSGDAGEADALLNRGAETGIRWENARSADRLPEIIDSFGVDDYSACLQSADPFRALEQFNRFRILCVLNKGPFGVRAVNRLVEQRLTRRGVITAVHRTQSPWYRGRPIIITRNDYRLGLYNGDIGIALPDPKGDKDELYVFFQGSHGETKRVVPHQLPAHETVYAMTVHKSQGSEFAKILLIIPDKDYAVLTRELVYTAVTRAREQVVICGNKPVLHTAMTRGIDRTSGLRDALWQ